MLRFFARFLGFWIFAAAIVAAIVDGAKSIAASAIVVTPLSETWAAIAASGGSQPPAEAPQIPWPLDVALAWLLAAPTVGVLALVGVLLMILGAKRGRGSAHREYAA